MINYRHEDHQRGTGHIPREVTSGGVVAQIA